MRVCQTKVPVGWVTRTADPNSVLVPIAQGAPTSNPLIDKGRFSTEINGLCTVDLDYDEAILFWAKDVDTLIRGFREVGKKKQDQAAFVLKSKNGNCLCVKGFQWAGDAPTSNAARIILNTIGYNIGSFAARAVSNTAKYTPAKEDWRGHGRVKALHYDYQNLKDNLAQGDRDGQLTNHGAGMLVTLSQVFPTANDVYRQIGDRMGMNLLGTIVASLANL